MGISWEYHGSVEQWLYCNWLMAIKNPRNPPGKNKKTNRNRPSDRAASSRRIPD